VPNPILDFFDKSFFQGIVSSAIYAILIGGIRQFANTFFITANPKWNRLRLSSVAVLWVAVNVLYIFLNLWHKPLFIFLTSAITIFFFWKETTQFWNGGLVRVDHTIEKGLNYEKSLKLCTNQLDFLGIGASKLTSDPEFEKTIKRCHRPNTPIRFLLTKPNNLLLIKAANQKGVNPNEYQKKVEASLGVLAHLRNDLNMNIEVRFYPSIGHRDMPLYRLMFIDNSICLVSYNVFGEGDGSQLPQLHIKRFENRRDVESFYHPFRLYFDYLWDDAETWDFKFPIT
jgi:hypothetical protein